jgi:hypothetical protein
MLEQVSTCRRRGFNRHSLARRTHKEMFTAYRGDEASIRGIE